MNAADGVKVVSYVDNMDVHYSQPKNLKLISAYLLWTGIKYLATKRWQPINQLSVCARLSLTQKLSKQEKVALKGNS